MKSTLILTKSDIQKLVSMKEAINIIGKAFRLYALGLAQMPAKVYIHLDRYKGDFRAMPAYLGRPFQACGLKWVNVHTGNRRFGLPSVMGVLILNDPKTGFPLSIMDATYLTNIRTGAAGGVAAKYLARRDSNVISIIGCGVQAETQLLALKEAFKIKLIKIYDISPLAVKRYVKIMKHIKLNIIPAKTIRDCIKDADIIVTTTPSRSPLVKSEWVKDGVHINAIGADAKGKQELEPKLLKRSKIVIDDLRQAVSSGEVNVPLSKGFLSKNDIYSTLGDIIIGKRPGRTSDKEITIFDSTGLAIQDVSIASFIYKKALSKGIGKRIDIVEP